jgi:hypothetical protein
LEDQQHLSVSATHDHFQRLPRFLEFVKNGGQLVDRPQPESSSRFDHVTDLQFAFSGQASIFDAGDDQAAAKV